MVGTRRRSYGPPAAKKRRKAAKTPLVGIDPIEDIVKVVAESGWINARDLLNLEQTCKAARSAVSTEEVWEALCLRSWPSIDGLCREFIQSRGGYRTWYKLRASRPPQRDSSYAEEPLPSPSLRATDIEFLVDIKVGDDTIISSIDNGDDMGICVENSILSRLGRVAKERLARGTTGEPFQYDLGDTKVILNTDDFESKVLTAEVQMVTDTHTCKIMMPNNRFYFDRQSVKESQDGKKKIYPVSERVGIPPHPIRSSLLGSAIQQRLGKPFSLQVKPIARFTDDGKKVVVDSLSFKFKVGESLFNKEIQDKTGVSILHVLEQLEGFPFPTCALTK